MKHKIALLLSALFLAVGLSWAQEGTTYYVNGKLSSYTNHDGSTAALAFQTINEALAEAYANGDGYVTINIAAGTYNENIIFDRAKVSLVGAGQDKTTIGGKTYTDAAIQSVITINSTTHVSLSNLRILSNGHVGTGNANIATVWIDEDCTTTDPIVINNVTIDQFVPTGGNNTGVGIRVANGASGATISNVAINDHTNGILVLANTTITNATLKGNGKTSAEYGIKVDAASTAVVVGMDNITATGYAKAGIYYNSNAISGEGSKLKNSTLKDSPIGLETVKGKLTVANSNIYGKGFNSPLKVSVLTPANIVLGEGTKLYKQFDGTAYEGFIAYGGTAMNVTDNGAQFFYGTNYAKSTVIKHSDSKGLKNAYPVEMIEAVFAYDNGLSKHTLLSANDIISFPEMTIETNTLQLETPITIEGNDATLKAKADQLYVLICDDADGTVIKNLTFSNAKLAGLGTDANIELLNVTLKSNLIGLLIVDGATVSATDLTTQNTKAGVILVGNYNTLSIVSGDYISEDLAVGRIANNEVSMLGNVVNTNNIAWTSIANKNNIAFSAIDLGGQLQSITDFWVRTLAIASITPPDPTTIIKGEQLWNSILTGGKAMYDGEVVSGVFQWKTPRIRVGVDAQGPYSYVFIPDNQKKFAPVLTGLSLNIEPLVYTKVTTAVLDWGKVVIKNASADDFYPKGQVLNLEYVPYEGYVVNPSASSTFTVGATDAEIGIGSFVEDTEVTEVTFEQPAGGMIQVFNNGDEIFSPATVKRGSLLNVITHPEAGKALKSITYQYGTPVLNGMITVGSEKIIIKTEMETKPSGTYVVGLEQISIKGLVRSTSFGIVMFYDESGNIYIPGMAVPSGTKLTPVVTPAFGYKLKSMGVTGGSIYSETVNGATKYTIDRDVKFAPVYEAVSYAVTASMDNDAAGTVRLSHTGLQPNTTAVTATITINAGYKLVTVIANGKELRTTGMGSTYTATANVFGETTFRVVTRKMEDILIDQTQQVYTYYGDDITYPFVVKTIATGLERLGEFTIRYREHSSDGPFNIIMPTAVGTYDVKITRVVGSYYNALDVVVKSGLKIADNYLPLRDMTHTRKNDPAKPAFTTSTATYDGSIFGNLATNPVTANNWVVTLRQNGLPILHPVNAGVYDIVGFRAADTLYIAQTNIPLGKFTINPAAANAAVTYATDILQGQSLAASRLSGNANIDGTFSWMAPETKMTKADSPITTEKAVFTPYSSNYTTDSNLATSLNVLAMAAGNLRTVTVNVTNPDKGSYTLTREAIEIFAGEMITAGEKIRVSFETTDPKYTAVVKINGTQYPNGAFYTVPATGDMVIDINFMLISQAPALIATTGINLSSLERVATMGDVFTLTPSITPSNASDQRIFWRSSDESIATVNADGKVTVHRAGSCAIIASTASGHSVSCELTAHTTANDGVIAGVNVYSLNRQYICIEAASPVKVSIVDALGRIVYNGDVSQYELIRLQAGVYFVVVTDQTSKATVKVVL